MLLSHCREFQNRRELQRKIVGSVETNITKVQVVLIFEYSLRKFPSYIISNI